MLLAKKKFGQHFLVNQGVIQKIVDLVKQLLGESREVYEIGPGQGALTGALLAKGIKVTAFEIDSDMVAVLYDRFASEIQQGLFVVEQGDALKRLRNNQLCLSSKQVLCGNLPYNVGTEIVMESLERAECGAGFCFMLQKEVVERLIEPAGSKAYGVTSVKMGWWAQQGDHFWVRPGSFSPPPQVDSGVMSYRKHILLEGAQLSSDEWTRAKAFVEKFFQKRRKMLGSVDPRLRAHSWTQRRPETLSPQEWLELWRTYGSL